MELPTLQSSRLTLREYLASDAEAVTRLAGDVRISSTTSSIPHPYRLQDAQAWIASLPAARDAGRSLTWAVTLGGELIGSASLAGLSLPHRRAELGYWIGVPWWGRGLATEASELLLQHGFRELGLERIAGLCYARNQASARVLEKLGMRYEGCLRRAMLKAGQFEDLEVRALLRNEFLERT